MVLNAQTAHRICSELEVKLIIKLSYDNTHKRLQGLWDILTS